MARYAQPAMAAGGPWTNADHAAAPAFDEPLARALVRGLVPLPSRSWEGRRVIDWGGGLGLYLALFAAEGAHTTLVEPILTPAPGPLHLRLDVGEPGAAARVEPADLVLCLEVLEHVERDRHPDALDNVCASVAVGGILVFSAATPGQGGVGHVAERPELEWRTELAQRGLLPYEITTGTLRDAATLPWLRDNLLVWYRPDPLATPIYTRVVGRSDGQFMRIADDDTPAPGFSDLVVIDRLGPWDDIRVCQAAVTLADGTRFGTPMSEGVWDMLEARHRGADWADDPEEET